MTKVIKIIDKLIKFKWKNQKFPNKKTDPKSKTCYHHLPLWQRDLYHSVETITKAPKIKNYRVLYIDHV